MSDFDHDPTMKLPLYRGQAPWLVVAICAGALCASLAANGWLWQRARRAEERNHAQTTVIAQHEAPRAPCPVCEVCGDAGPCPVCPAPVAEVHRDGGTGSSTPRPPRVDEALAAAGENHIAGAADAGERDPVHRAAQRNVMTAVDNIAQSHSGPAAERFLQRNLPAIASMDCAFRDPALAEHVRMRLRELNTLARPQARLTEEQLVRYERDLRCPRE